MGLPSLSHDGAAKGRVWWDARLLRFERLRDWLSDRGVGRALRVAVSLGVPLALGLASHHPSWGVLATLGAFASLYGHEESYMRRAMVMVPISLALPAAFALGVSLSGSTLASGLGAGLVAGLAVFGCLSLGVDPPGAYPVALVCLLGTSMPHRLPDLPQRTAVLLLGACFATVLSLAGWFVASHGPERRAVAACYRAIGKFLLAIGSGEADMAQHDAAVALQRSRRAVTPPFGLRPSERRGARRLRAMHQAAEEVFLAAAPFAAERRALDSLLKAETRTVLASLGGDERACFVHAAPAQPSRAELRLHAALSSAMRAIERRPPPAALLAERPARLALQRALGRGSLIARAALRTALAVAVAVVLARVAMLEHSVWLPITTAAVLQGTNVSQVTRRALQRSIGTLIGVAFAGLLTLHQPNVSGLVLVVMALQFASQMVIARNYAVGVVLITPVALLLSLMATPGTPPSTLVVARLLDTVLGALVAFAATFGLFRRASSRELPVVLADAISATGVLLERVYAPQTGDGIHDARQVAETHLLNLRGVYDDASSDTLREGRAGAAHYWPAVTAVQRLCFLAVSNDGRPSPMTEAQRAALAEAMQAFSRAATSQEPVQLAALPRFEAYPRLSAGLAALQDALDEVSGEPRFSLQPAG